ncbi:MAG: 50S ribosomal protein L29 [Polyangiaceae bacterium]|jgi:large subunit ribosomal protein L29|nr:50S ribosomal protein L29 [Polyangiaceae bacterium]
MKSKDLRERSSADLTQLREMMKKDLFSYRMKNLTNQLDDTSLLRKTRRDIARIELILNERAVGSTGEAPVEKGSEP